MSNNGQGTFSLTAESRSHRVASRIWRPAAFQNCYQPLQAYLHPSFSGEGFYQGFPVSVPPVILGEGGADNFLFS